MISLKFQEYFSIHNLSSNEGKKFGVDIVISQIPIFIRCFFTIVIFVFLISCEKINPSRTVKISTDSITYIGTTSCCVSGTLIDLGETGALQVGFCWSTTDEPTIWASKSELGIKIAAGIFSDSITGLYDGAQYYIRAYAQVENETYYGNSIHFFTKHAEKPTTEILPISEITTNSAIGGGIVTDDGGTDILARGVCWDTAEHPTIFHNKTVDGSGMGPYVSNITGLSPNTRYYVRTYATSAAGTGYNDQWEFRTMNSFINDYDGNNYYTVVIGDNEWTARNLNTNHYQNGDAITYVSDSIAWEALEAEAYCYFNNDPNSFEEDYGALYNWYAVDDSRGLCPPMWHVPTYEEFKALIDFAGGKDVAGWALKEPGTEHWASPNATVNNAFSFSALGGGHRGINGNYYQFGTNGSFWTSTPNSIEFAYKFTFNSDGGYVNDDDIRYVRSGFSVRCVKDQ